MEGNFFSTKSSRMLGSLTLLMVIIALGSYASLNFEKVEFINPMPATISVTGEGEVLAVPDIGRFSFSVMAETDSAASAQEESGTKMNEILAYLKEQGVEDKDVKTQDYNLYPRYRYEERHCLNNSYCPPGERVEDGFTVTQTVSVKVRETDKAGAIIAGVGERGATNISGLNFTIDDPEKLKADARAKAIEDAKMKAEVLAKQLNVRVVRMTGYYEESGDYYEPYAFNSKVMAMDMEESAFGGANMPTGEESTTARVTVVYEVK